MATDTIGLSDPSDSTVSEYTSQDARVEFCVSHNLFECGTAFVAICTPTEKGTGVDITRSIWSSSSD